MEEQEPSCDNRDQPVYINLSSLMPEELLKMKIEISNIEAEALVDTGSSTNFMKKSLASSIGVLPNPSNKISTKGIGSGSFKTLGEVNVRFSFYEIATKVTKFQVVEDDMISDQMILGWSFCKEYRLVIDSASRQITVHHRDGSRTHIFLDSKSLKARKIISENIKIYATSESMIESSLAKIQVNFSRETYHKEMLYYDGECKDTQLRGIEGVLDSTSEEKFVFLQKKCQQDGKSYKIKKGDVLGCVNTVLEVEEEEDPSIMENQSELLKKVKIVQIKNVMVA